MLKLLLKGVVQKDQHYSDLLKKNKFYFIPILNVDGVAAIEEGWEKDHKILAQRKNMDTEKGHCSGGLNDESVGVDLNRNFAVDFGQIDEMADYQKLDKYDLEWMSMADTKHKR